MKGEITFSRFPIDQSDIHTNPAEIFTNRQRPTMTAYEKRQSASTGNFYRFPVLLYMRPAISLREPRASYLSERSEPHPTPEAYRWLD